MQLAFGRRKKFWLISALVAPLVPILVIGSLVIGVLFQVDSILGDKNSAMSDSALTETGEGLENVAYDKAKFHAAWIKFYKGGVLVGSEQDVIQVANKAGVSPALIAAIMGTESGWGTSQAVKRDNNPSGQMSGGSIIHFSSLREGIEATGATLHNLVVERHLTTVAKLGAAYAPVGASNDPNNLNAMWVTNVTSLMKKFGGGSTLGKTNVASSKVGKITWVTGDNTYPVGQCTWWVKARLPWSHNWWGNGADWGASAAKSGYRVDHTPEKGAIVSFKTGQRIGNWTADPMYGHVAVVEAYDAGKGTITISQGGTGFQQQPGPNLQTIGNVSSYTYVHKK